MDEDNAYGHEAESPTKIPMRGWWQVAKRVKDETSKDNLSILAAGVAFYAILALPPALASLVAFWAWIGDPATLQSQIASWTAGMPESAAGLVEQQLDRLVNAASGTLGLTAILSLLLSLYSATKATNAVIAALNIAYDEEEKRGFLKLTGISYGLTVLGVVFVVLLLGLVAVVPVILETVGLGGATETLLAIGRWPVLALAMITALGVLYRYAPDRDEPQWRWASPGAITATVLFLVASALFSLYVSQFGSYNETYGALGAVVVLMLWLFISAFVVLIGAELNAELEHQTTRDTTKGPPQPRGWRGAYVADDVPDWH